MYSEKTKMVLKWKVHLLNSIISLGSTIVKQVVTCSPYSVCLSFSEPSEWSGPFLTSVGILFLRGLSIDNIFWIWFGGDTIFMLVWSRQGYFIRVINIFEFQFPLRRPLSVLVSLNYMPTHMECRTTWKLVKFQRILAFRT